MSQGLIVNFENGGAEGPAVSEWNFTVLAPDFIPQKGDRFDSPNRGGMSCVVTHRHMDYETNTLTIYFE